MSTQIEKALAVATKISARAENALSGLETEMTIMRWPPDFRVIMWEAVAHLATIRAQEARSLNAPDQKG